MGIPVSDRPSAPCLATRLPYGDRIEKGSFGAVGSGEMYLKSLGFSNVRIRQHRDVSRIEVERQEFPRFLNCMMKSAKIFRHWDYAILRWIYRAFVPGSMDEYLFR